jgi:hypothetical protein
MEFGQKRKLDKETTKQNRNEVTHGHSPSLLEIRMNFICGIARASTYQPCILEHEARCICSLLVEPNSGHQDL